MRNNNFSTKRNNRPSPGEEAKNFFNNNLEYCNNWITNQADAKLVTFAEEAGKFMAEKKLTNSKIRSIYGEIKRIQMAKDFEIEKASFFLLKPKVAYALGRDKNNEGLHLFKLIFDRATSDVSDKNTYLNFCNLIEAILAYHKANGGE